MPDEKQPWEIEIPMHISQDKDKAIEQFLAVLKQKLQAVPSESFVNNATFSANGKVNTTNK